MWRHPSPEDTAMARFARHASRSAGRDLSDYRDLHAWAVRNHDAFWRAWLHRSPLVWRGDATEVMRGSTFTDAAYFPNVTLNAAANLLQPAWDPATADTPAIVARGETRGRREVSYRDLLHAVLAARAVLQSAGVARGDRVAAIVPNDVEAVVAMLATVSLGAIWSSAAAEFGSRAILDRFSQIDPVVLIAVNGYTFNGSDHDRRAVAEEVAAALPSLRLRLAIGHQRELPLPAGFSRFDPVGRADDSGDGVAERNENDAPSTADAASSPPDWPLLPFDHPMYILYSSGTTGVPKCIVHGAGGTLLEHAKELMLHSDVRPGDALFYFTTCGWMMWNWLVSALAVGARIVLYEGSPMAGDPYAMWRMCSEERLTHFGTSPRYLGACRNAGVDARGYTGTLRAVLSTGAPLLPEDFDYVHESIAPQAQIASISGGTDIVGCFMLGNPLLPVVRGEIQAVSLGMDVAAVDDAGTAIIGSRGELVCRAPFPSRPVAFWGDTPDRARFRAAYLERFGGWWTHGDWIEITGSVGTVGGIIIYGRSDATLNPGGVRIGTAEIYRVVERIPGIGDSLVVGRRVAGDVEVILFVVEGSAAPKAARQFAATREADDARSRRPGEPAGLPEARLAPEIRARLRREASPRHVPARIFAVRAIPYTASGKKVELAVRTIVEGGEPSNREAIANADCLAEYRAIARALYGSS